MNRDIVWTNQFKKDYKLALKRHLDVDLLDNIIRTLSRGEPLPEKNRDHALTGDWIGHRECHIQPDWLLDQRRVKDQDLPFAQHFHLWGLYRFFLSAHARTAE